MLQIELDDQVSEYLRDLRTSGVPTARQNLMRQLMSSSVSRIQDLNPVRTGRSRNAWQAASQSLEGRTGSGASNDHSVNQTNDQTTTETSVTNAVPYVAYLEYGTSHMRPIAMVRRALQEIRQRVAQLFRLS